MYIRTTFKSTMLMRATDVHVFLPFHDGYPDAEAPFPTLYFLPGYSANAEELATCLPFHPGRRKLFLHGSPGARCAERQLCGGRAGDCDPQVVSQAVPQI